MENETPPQTNRSPHSTSSTREGHSWSARVPSAVSSPGPAKGAGRQAGVLQSPTRPEMLTPRSASLGPGEGAIGPPRGREARSPRSPTRGVGPRPGSPGSSVPGPLLSRSGAALPSVAKGWERAGITCKRSSRSCQGRSSGQPHHDPPPAAGRP